MTPRPSREHFRAKAIEAMCGEWIRPVPMRGHRITHTPLSRRRERVVHG